MNPVIVYQKLRKVIESCSTHYQLKVARNMIKEAIDNEYLKYLDEFYEDLMDRYYEKWHKIESIEDYELLEKMNAKTESQESASKCSVAFLCN